MSMPNEEDPGREIPGAGVEPARRGDGWRPTVWRGMAAVALIALLLIWPASLWLKREEYRRRYEQHEDVARVLSSEIITLRKQGGHEREAKQRESIMIDESRLAGVYLRAMQHPWSGPGRGEGEPRPPK